MLRRIVSALVVFLFLSAAVSAQQGPDNEPAAAQGYVNSIFRSSSIDSINQFNGQLTVPIAVGPSYPVSAKLKFQALLVHNSKATEFGNPRVADPSGAYQPLHGDPALGIGWNFRIGKVGWCGSGLCYFGPDGAEHVFDDAAPPRPDGTPCLQTSDGGQLLLCGPVANRYDLWDGDGNHSVFDWVVSGYDDAASDYIHDFGRGRNGHYVTSIADPFGNRILVDYYTGTRPCAFVCLSSPTHFSRMQCGSSAASWIPKSVRIQPAGGVAAQVLAVNLNADQMIGSLGFEVLAGGSRVTAVWTMVYEDLIFARGDPNCRSTSIKTLAELRLPTDVKGPTGIAGDARYEFTYDPYVVLLTSLRLPTTAQVVYDWGVYHFHHGRISGITTNCNAGPPPATAPVEVSYSLSGRRGEDRPSIPGPSCDPGDYEDLYLKTQVGVVARTVTGSGLPTGTTNYTQYAFPFGERGTSASRQPAQTLTVVVSPADIDGRRRAETTLFWAGPKSQTARGVPGERTGASLRHAVYDHDPNPSFAVPDSIDMPLCGGNADSLCGTHAARVSNRTYEYDDPAGERRNRRLKTETTYYGPTQPDGACSTCRQHTVTYSLSPFRAWESNGRHYNVESHSGNLGSDSRTITTNWTASVSPWLPNLFSQRAQVQSGTTEDRYYFFDSATGFLQAEILWDGSPSIRRVFGTCRYPDGSGNALQEITATSTYPGPPDSNPCPPTFASWPAVTIGLNGDAFGEQLAHQRGQPTQARWLKDRTPLSWYALDQSHDSLTGWVIVSRDTAGLSTSYLYDSLGRVTRITPPAEAATVISYDTPSQTTATRAGGAGLNTWNQYLYDGLGRPIRERRLMPAGASVKRFTRFDAAGNEYFSSEWVADSASESIVGSVSTACVFSGGTSGTARPSAAPGTYRLCFDPFGRPQEIIGANHSSLTTIDRTDPATPASWYSDTLEAVTTRCVNGTLATSGSCGTGGANATTITRRDAFGRVTRVTEPGGEWTDYVYDVNDRLTSVTQGAQSRAFSYDMAGFLRFETTPEKGTVAWGEYGGLGNPLQMTEGGVSHTFSYDAAGRLAGQIAGGVRYLTNCYDGGACEDGTPGFAGGTYRFGKLTKRIGYNPLATSVSRVIEEFSYSHSTGRLSSKTTTMTSKSNASVLTGASSPAVETFDYNGLGLLKSYGHPRVAGSFVETPGYDAGLPVSLTANGQAVVTAATYQPTGALASYTAGNGVTTTITPDLSLSGRPSRIAARRGTSILFDTGTYSYDGAGNLLKIGSDTFTYDPRSRLNSATLAGFPTQDFAHDRYGNLTRLGAQLFDVDSAKNRIKTPAAAYDGRGNVTANAGQSLGYDLLNRQASHHSSGADWQYMHTAASERGVRTPSTYDGIVLRREAARYIEQARALRGNGGRWTTTCAPSDQTFPDVSCSDADWGYIKKLFEDGISTGCGGGNFCPDAPLLRRQLAVLLVTAVYGSGFTPQAATGIFSDVPKTDPYARWIEQLSRDGVTAGCGAGKFCPDAPVTESQMLLLIRYDGYWDFNPVRAGSTYTYRDPANRVATEYLDSTLGRDNLYFGNLLVATCVFSSTMGTPGWQFYASDHLGTPRIVTGPTGALVETRKYYPYGQEASGPPTMQRIRFAAMERDSESNRYYDHARHHDFTLGRFLSPDQLQGGPEDPQSWNRYAYAGNNPLLLVDPDGLAPTIFQEAAAAAISAGSSVQQLGGSLNQGNAIGIGADAILGSVGSFIESTGDLLNLGTSIGDAIGKGGDSYDIGRGLATDLGRAAGITLLAAPIVGRGITAAHGALPTTVVHATDDAGNAAISAFRQLRAGTYVTKPREVRGLTPRQIEAKLEIRPGRGEHLFTARVRNRNLKVPASGPRTSGEAYQRQLTKACDVANLNCSPVR